MMKKMIIKRFNTYSGALAAAVAMGMAVSCAAPAYAGEAAADLLKNAAEAIKEAAEETTEGAAEAAEELAEGETDIEENSAKESGAEDNDADESTENPSKEESVYVIAAPDGSIKQIISSSHLSGLGDEDEISDQSFLDNIENVKGDETFTQDEDGTITWDAQGKDIYYQAAAEDDSENTLPVKVTETYFLDGEEMTADEITGKSGRVTIRFDYENTLAQEVTLGESGSKKTDKADEDEAESNKTDETVTLHTPFIALTGAVVSDADYLNIEVTGGKAVSDGEHTAIVGAAFPGMAQDLQTKAFSALSSLTDIKLTDYVEISADVENFEPLSAYTLITNEFFNDPEIDFAEVLDKAETALSSLTGGVSQIAGGIGDLNDGAGELKSGASDLADGLAALTESSEDLNNGAASMFAAMLEAAGSQLEAAGIPLEGPLSEETYSQVLEAVSENEQLPEEAKIQVKALKEKLDQAAAFCEGLAEYTGGVDDAKEGADSLKSGAASLQAGAAKLSLGITIMQAAIPDLSGVSDALKASVQLAKEYNTWSGISEEMNGRVRFLWVTR